MCTHLGKCLIFIISLFTENCFCFHCQYIFKALFPVSLFLGSWNHLRFLYEFDEEEANLLQLQPFAVFA